ncbi:type II toxin-antitoxin system PemK/MazF family toxin [Desulfoscipio geothermicus]|uniref:PemK-like, MazF-like toxin of type II toxin-antitoxin system n=1 Tax=Desulfoscipio geothermicus DSM 3669 TaxID=1121426 RepID=A0A1I6EM70_9FIRM|nr:type II toxin-antitoxin system PemK/MazF family toxin [Desulfoscipio geothermicus]SFR18651.1 PemK-like, MazF-like toxin of type II toxin-antitoxin system [Desulfoscipio geothermicus DSM 3669]
MSDKNEVTAPYRSLQLYDIREFEVGEAYYIKDELIRIPTIDRSTEERNYHPGRRVVIAHNSNLNADPTWPLVHVAPLSHRVDLMRETDIEVTTNPDDGDGVAVDSIIQLALVQPVLKVDLERKVGKLSREKIAEMLALQEDMLLGEVEPLEE